jgi:hypothetical protein
MRHKDTKADSERSMISKPFVQRIAILAFKKMRSYDSDGRKKSCQMELTTRGHSPDSGDVYVRGRYGTTLSEVVAGQVESSETLELLPSR